MCLSEDESGNGRQCLDDSDLWNGTVDAGAGAGADGRCAVPLLFIPRTLISKETFSVMWYFSKRDSCAKWAPRLRRRACACGSRAVERRSILSAQAGAHKRGLIS